LGARYREEVARHKGAPGDLNPQVTTPIIGAIRHIYVAADEREVEQIATPAYRTYYNNITKLWLDFRTIPAVGFTPELSRACQMEVAHAGTAQRICDELGLFFESTDCKYLVLSFAWGGLEQDAARRSLDRFVTRVMPQFVNSAGPARAVN